MALAGASVSVGTPAPRARPCMREVIGRVMVCVGPSAAGRPRGARVGLTADAGRHVATRTERSESVPACITRRSSRIRCAGECRSSRESRLCGRAATPSGSRSSQSSGRRRTGGPTRPAPRATPPDSARPNGVLSITERLADLASALVPVAGKTRRTPGRTGALKQPLTMPRLSVTTGRGARAGAGARPLHLPRERTWPTIRRETGRSRETRGAPAGLRAARFVVSWRPPCALSS